MRKQRVWLLAGAGLLLGLSASAVEVYLNGVQVTGAKDQVIDNAKVTLDKNGNVHILAPDYKVQEIGVSQPDGGPPAAAQPVRAALAKHYYVVTETSRPGVTGYTIQVMVNDRFLKALSDDIPQDVVELSEYLREGQNTVSFRAVRLQGRTPKSNLASDTFSVLLGEGKGEPGGQLVIDEVLGEFKVTAADSGEKAQSFTVRAR
ncbi:MAG: hypothetical protein GYA21_06780 [Myxococcales bacterium]|nr:hypothetical protein [Myxococcales bacterium]